MTLSIKLSLLSLIARVFAPYKRKVQGIYALGVILIIYYMASWILKIRICAPISAYWHLEFDKCLDQSAIILGDSIVSTVTDAIILVLPLPLTWSLQIPNEKKLRVGGMLAVGGLATAFSAWRLHLILTNGTSRDATILFVQVVLSGYVRKRASVHNTEQSTNSISQQRRSRPRPDLHLPTSLRRPVPAHRKRRALRLFKEKSENRSQRLHGRRRQSGLHELAHLRHFQVQGSG
jgi:hypothetical protein